MLNAAQAAGESFLDVISKDLHKQVAGAAGGGPAASSARSLSVCCRLMTRMMIPGDHILSGPGSENRATLFIRYRLPR